MNGAGMFWQELVVSCWPGCGWGAGLGAGVRQGQGAGCCAAQWMVAAGRDVQWWHADVSRAAESVAQDMAGCL